VKRKPKFVATWLQDETSTAVYRPNFVDFFEVKQTTTVKRGKGGKKKGQGHNQKTTSSNSDKNHETPNGIVNPIPHVVSLQPMKDKSAEALREYRNKRVDTLDDSPKLKSDHKAKRPRQKGGPQHAVEKEQTQDLSNADVGPTKKTKKHGSFVTNTNVIAEKRHSELLTTLRISDANIQEKRAWIAIQKKERLERIERLEKRGKRRRKKKEEKTDNSENGAGDSRSKDSIPADRIDTFGRPDQDKTADALREYRDKKIKRPKRNKQTASENPVLAPMSPGSISNESNLWTKAKPARTSHRSHAPSDHEKKKPTDGAPWSVKDSVYSMFQPLVSWIFREPLSVAPHQTKPPATSSMYNPRISTYHTNVSNESLKTWNWSSAKNVISDPRKVAIIFSGVGYRSLGRLRIYSENVKRAKDAMIKNGFAAESIITIFVAFSNYKPAERTDEYVPDVHVDKQVSIWRYGVQQNCSDTTETNAVYLDPFRYYDMFRAVSAGIAYAKEIGAGYVLRHRIDLRIINFQLESIHPGICYGFKTKMYGTPALTDNLVFGDIDTIAEVFEPPISPMT
jgi:hypothetical protein